jgi:hypothetical protein
MKEIHFYSSKIKSLLLLIVSIGFCLLISQFYKNLGNEGLGKVILFYFGVTIFIISSILSTLLILRRKPLLIITDTEIIIHYLLRKSVSIKFEEISKFFTSNTTYRGIKTNEYINIVMKYPKNPSQKRFLGYSSSQEIIQTDMLNVKTSELLKILNKKLKSCQSQDNL